MKDTKHFDINEFNSINYNQVRRAKDYSDYTRKQLEELLESADNYIFNIRNERDRLKDEVRQLSEVDDYQRRRIQELKETIEILKGQKKNDDKLFDILLNICDTYKRGEK